jgi:cytidylate kinase
MTPFSQCIMHGREVMSMSVVTISREFGSEGSTIARQVARKLGYHFVDKDVMGQVLIQYGFVEFKQEYDSAPSFWNSFDSRRAEMVGMLNRVVRALARHNDVVILGRGSLAVLDGFADVLNVRIQAPLSFKIKRVMARENIDNVEQAEALVEENNKVRAMFIEWFYNVPWDTASAFDVVLDTSKVPPELAVNWLVDTVNAMNETKTGGEQTTRAIEVDPILTTVVADVLENQVAVVA